ncbi:MAG: hypothetical protein K2N03_08845 [Muribaculaceae bacterium]|nr:hypothetical protein [Muribaculaceae bacterium]
MHEKLTVSICEDPLNFVALDSMDLLTTVEDAACPIPYVPAGAYVMPENK